MAKLGLLKPNDVGGIIVMDGGLSRADDPMYCLALPDKWNKRKEKEAGMNGEWERSGRQQSQININ